MAEISEIVLRRTGAESVVLTWDAGDASEWFVWQDGALVARVSVPEYLARVSAGTYAVWQVFDDAGDQGDYAQSGHVWLGWHAIAGAVQYRVEELVDSAWAIRQTVVSRGEAYHVHRTRWLEDSTNHQYRVVPVGGNGVDGDPMVFLVRMTRHPDVPVVSGVWDGGTEVFSVGAG